MEFLLLNFQPFHLVFLVSDDAEMVAERPSTCCECYAKLGGKPTARRPRKTRSIRAPFIRLGLLFMV
jgi:hypothetical protein